MFPMLWAQTGPEDGELVLLSLRRWFQGLTLSSPEIVPRSTGWWVWMAGLLVLLLVCVVVQGPARCLGQILNIAGHVRLLGLAIERLRRSGRLLMIVLGVTVVAWSASMVPRYDSPEQLRGLQMWTRQKSLGELATEQGVFTAITPLRDIVGLGSMVIMLIPASVRLFRLSSKRWSHDEGDLSLDGQTVPGITTLYWSVMGVYACYLLMSMFVPTAGLPLGGCLIVEAVLIPILMLISEGVVVAWVLAELGRSSRRGELVAPEPLAVVNRVPASILVCLLTMPSRYAGVGAFLLLNYALVTVADQAVTGFLTDWGLIYLQGIAIPGLVLVGVASVSDRMGLALRRIPRILAESGGRLWGWALLCTVGGAIGSGLSYLAVLSLPAQPWVLDAADAYAHYASLPFGLVLVSGLIELTRNAIEQETENWDTATPARSESMPLAETHA